MNGRLGHGDGASVLKPQDIKALDKLCFKHISAGGSHSLVVTDENQVYSFGFGKFGRLGHGGMGRDVSVPKLLQAEGFAAAEVLQICAGLEHSMALISTTTPTVASKT